MVEAMLPPEILGRTHVAGGRQPAELTENRKISMMPSQKFGVEQAPQREDVGRIVPHAVLLHRRDDAGGDADRERDDDRHRGELQRDRQLLQDEIAHRHLDAHRLAEIARQHALASSTRTGPAAADRAGTAARICSITAGSRSSPAMTRAGSPGSSCCSEKMITDTKNSVGTSCRSRRPRKASCIARWRLLTSASARPRAPARRASA